MFQWLWKLAAVVAAVAAALAWFGKSHPAEYIEIYSDDDDDDELF